MRSLLPLSLALLVSVLTGCGGDADRDAGPGDVGGASPASFEEWADHVELTDDMMEDFFAVAEDMQAVEDDPAKGLAVMAKHGWNMERWTWVAGQLATAIQAEAIDDSRADIEQSFPRMEERLEVIRGRVAAATGEERKAKERELEQFEMIYAAQKKTLTPMLEGAAKSADRNRAILAEYRDRWEALAAR